MQSIGQRIRQARQQAGFTQEQLAEGLGTTKATISRWENGNVDNIAMNKIERLSSLCGVDPAWILSWSSEQGLLPQPGNKRLCILNSPADKVYPFLQESASHEFVDEASGIDFCLRAPDDSMSGARILQGDVLFVRRQQQVAHGDIAVLVNDQEQTLIRRVYVLEGSYILHAENPVYSDIVLSAKAFRRMKVLGIAEYVKFKV